MRKFLSFRLIRNIGLGILTCLVLAVSGFSFIIIRRINAKIGLVMEQEHPALNAVLEIQSSFIDAYPIFQKFIIGESELYPQIQRYLTELEQFLATPKLRLPATEEEYLQKFKKNIKYLKYTLKSYHIENLHDPASSNAAELNDITSQKMNQATEALNYIVANIRHRIQLTDTQILAGLQRDRRLLLVFLVGAIITSFAVMILLNRALARPVSILIEGAREIGAGNLDWRVELEHKDEFGQLANSLNDMAEKLQSRNRELKETQDQLVQAGKMAAIGQLSAGVSHELNNPLGGILGYSQFILEKGEKNKNIIPDELKNVFTYVGYIERESQRCKTIVANLLKFSRSSNTDISELDINKVLEETFVFTRHQLEMHQVEVIPRLAPHLPQIRGNEHQLQQVFTNLMVNAQQAMPEGGKLTVNTAQNNGTVEISFADTGRGIPKENLDKLFDPFFTTKPAGEGTGLGLSVTYGIIRDMGGEISVESELGKGTTFCIKLPPKTANKEKGAISTKERSYHGWSRSK